MRPKRKLPRNAKLILVDLCRARRPLSVRRISERNDVHWKTANDNIQRLEKQGLVSCERGKNRTMCQPSKKIKNFCETIRPDGTRVDTCGKRQNISRKKR